MCEILVKGVTLFSSLKKQKKCVFDKTKITNIEKKTQLMKKFNTILLFEIRLYIVYNQFGYF